MLRTMSLLISHLELGFHLINLTMFMVKRSELTCDFYVPFLSVLRVEYVVDALTTKCGKEGVWAIERLLNQARGDGPLAVWFGKLLYAPLPNEDERGMILKALALKKSLDADVDLVDIGRSDRCTNYQMNEAAMAAVEDKYSKLKRQQPLLRTQHQDWHHNAS
ncbi:cell division cycle 48C [Artemisia annua]|uniref:Cell division cycle 48C n=1 Tax=Artemisia annua TaxID=35608 RepID=A0A2U1KM77_ARTAN|nr:cell division cycle 48C [Artemisia annua]